MSKNNQQIVDDVEALKTEVARLKTALTNAEQDKIELAKHKQTVKALQQSEARFRSLSESSPIGIFQSDILGNCLYTNACWQKISGLSAEDSLGQGWCNAIHPEDKANVMEHWTQCLREGIEFRQKFRLLTAKGEIGWVNCHATTILNDFSEVAGYVGTVEDITETKLAESLRRQANRDLREMSIALSNAVEGISRLDIEGRYVSVNDAYARMVGYPSKEMLGMNWRKTVHPDDLDNVVAAYRTMFDAGKVEVETRGVRKDGSIFFKQLFMVSAFDEQKQLAGHYCFMKDVTERKQAEVNLHQLNQELENRVRERTAELSQVNTSLHQELIRRQEGEVALQRQVAREKLLGVMTQNIRQSFDLDGILTTAVNDVRQILQADRALIFQLTADQAGVVVQESVLSDYPVTVAMRFPDEWFSQECYEYYCQGKPRIVFNVADDAWASCLAEFMQSVNVKSKIVAPIVQNREDNSPFVWGLLIVHACADYREWQPAEAQLLQQIANQMAIALKQAELYQQLQKELADRKQAQASLEQSEALFRSLCESSPVGIFRNDHQGRCIYTNPRFQEITGLTFAEALGNGWQQCIHPEDRQNVLAQWLAEMAVKPESSAELRYCRKDSTIRFCQIKAAPILSLNNELLGYVGTIEDITDRRAVEQMKNEFVSIVSHELRTPLASIRGSLGLLASEVLKDDPATAKHMLSIAAVETERLVRLVSDILDLERLTSNQVVLDRQWCDATTLMQQAIEILQPLADENQIELTLIPLSAQIWVAPDRLIQTLVNLLSNAIKFSPAGSTVTLNAQSQTNRILFQVQDQGRGIPADKLEAIFGRFQQLDATDSRDKGGTGLGLTICRNIVQQHGGQIWVESVVGQGSTFSFTIPISLE